jgi:hypothetical protein
MLQYMYLDPHKFICLCLNKRFHASVWNTLSQRNWLFWWFLQSWSNFPSHTAEWTSRGTWTVYIILGWLIFLLFQILLTFGIANVATASLVLIVKRCSLVRGTKVFESISKFTALLVSKERWKRSDVFTTFVRKWSGKSFTWLSLVCDPIKRFSDFPLNCFRIRWCRY